jgi:hypothetical protein
MRNWSSKLFENQSDLRAERIVSETNKRYTRYFISKTLIVRKMMKYNLVKEHMLILYEYMRTLKMLGFLITRQFGKLIRVFVLMSYSSFIRKVVMIGWMKRYRLNCFAILKECKRMESSRMPIIWWWWSTSMCEIQGH